MNRREKESVAAILGSPIAYYAVFAKALGCVEAGVFVSQMFYWYGKGHDPDGWIYKTQDDIFEETGLTRRNQEMARRKMRQKGVHEEVKRGVPGKLYYRLNLERLFEVVQESLTPNEPAGSDADDEDPSDPPPPEPSPTNDLPEGNSLNSKVTSKDVQSVHPRMSKTRIQGCPKRTSLDVQNAHSSKRDPDIQASAIRPNKDARSGQTNTETTTKSTTEITTKNTHGGGGASQPSLFGLSNGQDLRARGLCETTRNEMVRTARAIISTLPQHWRSAGRYVDDLGDEQLRVLLTWLWLWQVTEAPTNGYDVVAEWQESEEIKKFYGEPFAGLDNIPGYIRRRVEENSAAELHEVDLDSLQQALSQTLSEGG